jgi:pyridoxamine 5'-phosphate oxidase
MVDVSQLRREYSGEVLDLDTLAADPYEQFERWLHQACNAKLSEPNAMSLATVAPQGAPSLRTVLLKYFDRDGFVFFTNYESRKAIQIAENPSVAAMFFWAELSRQVTIEGVASPISTAASLKYFATRPRGSQLGAWCSPQSSVISSRQLLQMKLAEVTRKFANREVPLPSFWGGYRIVPHRIEFWQGQENRLHDRFLYELQEDGPWSVVRLAP